MTAKNSAMQDAKHLPNDLRNGFTLIEMIASMAIVAILAAIAGIGLVQLTEGFFISQAGAEMAQKAQLTMTRLVKEFNHITDVSAGSSLSIRFDSFHAEEPGDTIRSFTVSWNGTTGDDLLMTCHDCPGGSIVEPLVDQVTVFDLNYIYYDAGGNRVTVSSRTPEWAAAFADPSRQTALRVRLQVQNTDYDELATTIFLGKHD
jgi:prepilin-type N-terminal cleavage/methylation domain-containing protein